MSDVRGARPDTEPAAPYPRSAWPETAAPYRWLPVPSAPTGATLESSLRDVAQYQIDRFQSVLRVCLRAKRDHARSDLGCICRSQPAQDGKHILDFMIQRFDPLGITLDRLNRSKQSDQGFYNGIR